MLEEYTQNKAVSFIKTDAVSAEVSRTVATTSLGEPLLSAMSFSDTLVRAPDSSTLLEISIKEYIMNIEFRSTYLGRLSVSQPEAMVTATYIMISMLRSFSLAKNLTAFCRCADSLDDVPPNLLSQTVVRYEFSPIVGNLHVSYDQTSPR